MAPLALLKNVRICDPKGPFHGFQTDILIENGLISKIGSDINDGEIIAQNHYVSLSWIDLAARCGEPGAENKETLSTLAAAAAAGGFGQVCLMPDFASLATDNKSLLGYIEHQNRHTIVDFWPIGAVSLQAKGQKLSNMLELDYAGAVAFSDGNHPIRPAALLYNVLQYLLPTQKTLFQKPEDASLAAHTHMHQGLQSLCMGLKGTPEAAETLALIQDLAVLAQLPDTRLHVAGISVATSLAHIRHAKAQNQRVTAHVPAYNLRFIDEDLFDFDANLKVSPPFRTKTDRAALIHGLLEGTIDAIASEHTPQNPESKDLEFDQAEFGIASIETAFSVALEALGIENLDILINALTSGPRRCLGLPPLHIQIGTEAKFTVFDPHESWIFEKNRYSKAQNTPLHGQMLQGKVIQLLNPKFY